MFGILLQQVTGIATTVADTANKVAQAAPSTVTGPPAESSVSLFEMVAKGGIILIPLALLLAGVIYVFFERLIVIMKAGKENPTLVSSLKEMLNNGNIDAAKALCKSKNSPIGNMLEKGISRLGKPTAEIKDAMQDAGRIELAILEHNMNFLNITGRVAPMFGFIGTILGVIKIFHDIALANTVQIDVVSEGLYKKMITSASGLIVGVVAFTAYHFLNGRIMKIENKMEKAMVEFMDAIN